MKKYSFIILAALFISCAGLVSPGCAQDSYDTAMEEYQKQAQEDARLKKKYWAEYQKAQDEEAKQKKEAWAKWDEELKMGQEQALRYEKILNKWEEQAVRYDRILDAMEKQYGVKKDK